MFNPRFFIDTMNVIDDEKVSLNIVSEDKPCLIEGEKDKPLSQRHHVDANLEN